MAAMPPDGRKGSALPVQRPTLLRLRRLSAAKVGVEPALAAQPREKARLLSGRAEPHRTSSGEAAPPSGGVTIPFADRGPASGGLCTRTAWPTQMLSPHSPFV